MTLNTQNNQKVKSNACKGESTPNIVGKVKENWKNWRKMRMILKNCKKIEKKIKTNLRKIEK